MGKLDEMVQYIKESGLPVFIMGGGEVAHLSRDVLRKKGITEVTFVVDNGIVPDEDPEIISKEFLTSNYSAYILIRGYLGAMFMSELEILRRWNGCVRVFTISNIYEGYNNIEGLSRTFFDEHKEDFIEVYESLEDEKSKRSLGAYLKAKTEGDNEALISDVISPQYFFEDTPWQPIPQDIFLDGGAFDGDTIESYIAWTGGIYTGIIACEPDSGNYEQLMRNIKTKNITGVRAVCKGLYNKKAVLRFDASEDTLSKISEEGNTEIEVDTIDNICKNEMVSIIKMDIEGSELQALIGAVQTIKKCRPILMICAYHKRDDVFRIFQFINNTVTGYKFYFRCHRPIPIEAVLYAVPEERITGNTDRK